MSKFKQWITRMFFKEVAMDAFRKAHADILETMRDDLDKKAEELAKEKLSNLLSLVDMNKIATLDKTKGFVYIGGKRIDDSRLSNLKAEADFLVQSDIWQLIYETPKELAQRSMFVEGETLDNLKKGRSMLYTLESQKNIIKVFQSYQPKKDLIPPSQIV